MSKRLSTYRALTTNAPLERKIFRQLTRNWHMLLVMLVMLGMAGCGAGHSPEGAITMPDFDVVPGGSRNASLLYRPEAMQYGVACHGTVSWDVPRVDPTPGGLLVPDSCQILYSGEAATWTSVNRAPLPVLWPEGDASGFVPKGVNLTQLSNYSVLALQNVGTYISIGRSHSGRNICWLVTQGKIQSTIEVPDGELIWTRSDFEALSGTLVTWGGDPRPSRLAGGQKSHGCTG